MLHNLVYLSISENGSWRGLNDYEQIHEGVLIIQNRDICCKAPFSTIEYIKIFLVKKSMTCIKKLVSIYWPSQNILIFGIDSTNLKDWYPKIKVKFWVQYWS